MNELNMVIERAQLPAAVKGITVKNHNSIKVFVNSGLSKDEQAAAFLHECLHIWNNDFNSGKAASEIEESTHKQLKRISAIYERG